MKFKPPQVSRYFRYDWQYAVDMSTLPLLRPAATVIAFMPLISKASLELFGLQIVTIPLSLWIMWFSSVAFVVSWLILKFYCPKFIAEYRDYGQYLKRQHSHRWIVWEFFNGVRQLSNWKRIVQETLAKGISVRCSDARPPTEYSVCPVFSDPTDDSTVEIFNPVNIHRDIYLPIHCYGEKLILLLQEDDPQLQMKEKELFWILYSQAAKESTIARVLFWIFFYVSVGLLGINVIKNVFTVWF